MQDLEGSSQLEKDTSLIFIIDREADTQNVVLRIVKGRNTGTANIAGIFAGWKLQFSFNGVGVEGRERKDKIIWSTFEITNAEIAAMETGKA